MIHRELIRMGEARARDPGNEGQTDAPGGDAPQGDLRTRGPVYGADGRKPETTEMGVRAEGNGQKTASIQAQEA